MAFDRPAAEKALGRVKAAQAEYWDALNDLEAEINHDLDSNVDFEGYTVDDLEPAYEIPGQ